MHINQSINDTTPALCRVCPGYALYLSMSPQPELPVTSCAAGSAAPGLPRCIRLGARACGVRLWEYIWAWTGLSVQVVRRWIR